MVDKTDRNDVEELAYDQRMTALDIQRECYIEACYPGIAEELLKLEIVDGKGLVEELETALDFGTVLSSMITPDVNGPLQLAEDIKLITLQLSKELAEARFDSGERLE